MGGPIEDPIFRTGQHHLRWSCFKKENSAVMLQTLVQGVFPSSHELPTLGSWFTRHVPSSKTSCAGTGCERVLRLGLHVVSLVFIDETGSVGKGARSQALLTVVAAIVKEEQVHPLRVSMYEIARKHLRWVPADLEFHGSVLWNAGGHWAEMGPPQLLAVYQDVIDLLEVHDVDVSYASIDKERLHAKYDGSIDKNAYLLALQFMLEKIERCYPSTLEILIADEQKEHQLRAMKMVKDMQVRGLGEVPSFPIKIIIDSIHFVDSVQSPGIQMADMVAYLLQRSENQPDKHPDAVAAIAEMRQAIGNRVHTYRQPWPS